MSDKLKAFILWASTILVLAVILFTFVIPLIALLVFAVFLPDVDTASLTEFSQNVSSFLGFTSVLLAIFSVWQAYKGNQEFGKIVNELQNLKEIQTDLISAVKHSSELSSVPAQTPIWKKDESK